MINFRKLPYRKKRKKKMCNAHDENMLYKLLFSFYYYM